MLFVDDDTANLDVWEAAYSDSFRVLTADGAEAAIELLGRHEVAVIVADQRMPKMTGIELLEVVREQFPNVVRMLITAYSDLGAAIDAINRGQVRRYIRKPCSLPELRAEITDALDVYWLRSRIRAAERRLLVTERVYSLGVVASGLGRELGRPAGWIQESVSAARAEIQCLVQKLDAQGVDPRVLRSKLVDLETKLDRAMLGADRVLDIAKSVELKSGDSESESVELAEVLRLALRVVRGEIRRGTDVQLDIQAVSPVRGTSAKLVQVAINLLVNAIEAVSEQPSEQRSIVVRLFEQSGTVRLEVMDNGPCFDERDLERLFDPFHTPTSARNCGIGLAISKAIIEESGGAFDVANRADGGVLFRVVLEPALRPLRRMEADAELPEVADVEAVAG